MRAKKAESADTSTLANANIAINVVANAKSALDRAEKAAEANSYEHEKDDKIKEVKAQLEMKDNKLNAEKGLHEVE